MATVERRARDGKVSYRVRYRDPSGAQRSKSFTRKGDADRYAREIESSKDKGNYVNPRGGKITFGDLAERWYATTASQRPSTRYVLRNVLNNHVLPAFGNLPINRIDRLMVSELLASKSQSGSGAGLVRTIHLIIKGVLNAGVDANLLAVNAAEGVRLPKMIRHEMRFLTPVEVDRLARTIREPYGVLIHTLAYTGLRWSELVALKVGRIDLLNRRLEVVEATVRVGGKLYTNPPKSGKRRTVGLTRSLAEELGAYLSDRPHGPDDLVFTSTKGGYPLRSNVFSRSWQPAIRAAGLEPLRIHDLRHTAASIMLAESRGDWKWVAKQLGHSNASMTLDRYGHLLPQREDEYLDRLDQARAAAVGEVWPERGPKVIELPRKGA